MSSIPENQNRRPKASNVLISVREQGRLRLSTLDPGEKMQAAFALSLETRRLFVAGLKTQGFTEAEISAALRKRNR